MRMRLMLLGGGSALGQSLIAKGAEEDIGFLAPRPPGASWDAAALTQLLDDTRPDAIVNLAFYYDWFQNSKVDEARLAAQRETVERLAELCQHHGIILLQPSSYRVFDGARVTAYGEADEPQPLGPLGQALLAMEHVVRSLCPRHVILRTGWILDDSRDGVLGRFLRRLEHGEPLELADDRRGNPCPVDDVARVILAILKQLDCAAPLWGTYHYGAQEATTVLALGQCMVAEARNLRTLPPAEIVPLAHAACADAPVEPQHGVLACKKILNTYGVKPRAWRAGLPVLLDRYFRHGAN